LTDYVKQIGERSVQVIAQTTTGLAVIRDLSGTSTVDADTWRIDYDTEDELATILQRLRDADVAFAGGTSGWPAAAVAELLREKGKFHGTIKEISWLGQGQEVVRQR
jgi:hypothetical protein